MSEDLSLLSSKLGRAASVSDCSAFYPGLSFTVHLWLFPFWVSLSYLDGVVGRGGSNYRLTANMVPLLS